ncbi:hypothetical protein N8T08_007346 [Aspergillus melleus]|uniref:Uncharacterized protein n=1 Tax=Aspergillus melleus TaxID=138277 RepID=A0ACC3AY59_9EURO|nr:hypothetical protein N8T08_007346 [Aspergillus melleus]
MEKQPFLFRDETRSCHDDDVEIPVPPASSPKCARRRRFVAALTIIGLSFIPLLVLGWSLTSTTSGFRLFSCHGLTRRIFYGFSTTTEGAELPLMDLADEEPSKVPLEAHIMSKCPDAQYCLQELVVPAMEQISDKVDFNLSFIATVSHKTSDIECKHGPSECIGNILILCAQELPFPEAGDARMPTIRSLGFANCLISSYEDIPDRELVQHCALEHGIDFDALNQCASQQEDDPGDDGLSGLALLRDSALHSADLGVKTSCTLRLDDSTWCVRDGGVWKDCAEDGEGSEVAVLVDEINKLWGERN